MQLLFSVGVYYFMTFYLIATSTARTSFQTVLWNTAIISLISCVKGLTTELCLHPSCLSYQILRNLLSMCLVSVKKCQCHLEQHYWLISDIQVKPSQRESLSLQLTMCDPIGLWAWLHTGNHTVEFSNDGWALTLGSSKMELGDYKFY